MKKGILILGLLTALNANAEKLPSCGENCTYSYVENGVDNDNNPTYTLTISPIDSSKPASIRDYDRIGYGDNYAPWINPNITQVEIKEGIKTIGEHAFENMGGSNRTLILPEGLETIGGEAFHGFNATSVTFPSTLKTIGSYAFDSRLSQINHLPEGLKTIGSQAFANSQLTDVVIPNSVKSLSATAFGGGGDGWNMAQISNLYCSKAQQAGCEAALAFRGDNATVTVYEIKDGLYFLDGAYYSSADNMQKDVLAQKNATGESFACDDLAQCKADVLKRKGYCKDDSDCLAMAKSNVINYKNKSYASIDDLFSGNYIPKRIYTVDEANAVAGKVNSVKIRYR